MPQRIEDVVPEIAFLRNTTKLSIVDENGNIKEADPRISPWEAAKANAERARNTLEGIGPTVYRIVEDALIDLSEKSALNAILSHRGKDDERDLCSLIACDAFNRMSKQGQAKALRIFLDEEDDDQDRHIFVPMMVYNLSFSSAHGVVLEDLCDHYEGRVANTRMQLSSLADTGILQYPGYFISISVTEYDQKVKTLLDLFDVLVTWRGRNCLIDLCHDWYILFGRSSKNDFLIDYLYSLATTQIATIFANNNISRKT